MSNAAKAKPLHIKQRGAKITVAMIRLADRVGEERAGGRKLKGSDSTQLYCKIGMTEYFSFR